MSDNIIPLRGSSAPFIPTAVLLQIMGEPSGRRRSPPTPVITVPGLERLKAAAERATGGDKRSRAAARRTAVREADAMSAVALWHIAEEAEEVTTADIQAAKRAIAALDQAGAAAVDDEDSGAATEFFRLSDFVRDEVLRRISWAKFANGIA